MPTPQHSSMYAASQEYYRMEKKTIVAARYVRNSDPSKKDSEVLNSQNEALLAYAREKDSLLSSLFGTNVRGREKIMRRASDVQTD